MSPRVLHLAALLAALLLAGCAPSASSPSRTAAGQGFPLTIIDDAGRSVTIDKEPQRIISLAASNTELIYAVGLQTKLVAVDDYSDYPPEAKAKEKVGGFSKPSIEKIVSLAPDLLLATQIHTKGVVADLENRGLKVVVIQPPTLDRVPDNLLLLGKISGKIAEAETVAAEMKKRIQVVTDKTVGAPKLRVFFELGPDLTSVGADTFLDDMITKAGGENIAREAAGSWPKLNPEAIVLKDPQVIVLGDMGSDTGGVTVEMVKSRPGWATISAVKSGRILPVPDRNTTDRPGPRAIEGLEFLAGILHPELFPAR